MIQPYSFNTLTQTKILERREKAQTLAENGETEKSILEYNRVIFLSPDNADFYIERAHLYLKLSDLASAIANFRKSLKIRQDTAVEKILNQLCFVKGMSLIDEGRVPAAMDFLEHNIKKDEQYHYLCALGYLGSGEKMLALKELEYAIEISPDSAVDALVLKGKILLSLDQKADGYDAFWKAFNINSSHPDVVEFVNIMKPLAQEWHDKAVNAIFKKEYKQGLYFIDKGLSIYKDSPRLLLLRAAIHRMQENYEEALDDLEKASRHMNFENISDQVRIQIALTYNDIGKSLYQAQKYLEAITPFNEAINFMSQDSGLFINRGDCYRMRGATETAMADYHHAIELGAEPEKVNPRLSALHNSIGNNLYSKGDAAGANIEFSRAIVYNPSVSAYYVNRSKTQIVLNQARQGYEDLQKAVELDPNNEEALRLLSNFKISSIPHNLPQNIRKLMFKQSMQI